LSVREIPAGLGSRGAALWDHVAAVYQLGPDEVELLVELCRTVDMAELLAAECSARPMVDGRYGPTVNAAMRELRLQRSEMRHLAAALGLPDSTGQPNVESGNTKRARRAANARWKEVADGDN
jgi:hypothetical protein